MPVAILDDHPCVAVSILVDWASWRKTLPLSPCLFLKYSGVTSRASVSRTRSFTQNAEQSNAVSPHYDIAFSMLEYRTWTAFTLWKLVQKECACLLMASRWPGLLYSGNANATPAQAASTCNQIAGSNDTNWKYHTQALYNKPSYLQTSPTSWILSIAPELVVPTVATRRGSTRIASCVLVTHSKCKGESRFVCPFQGLLQVWIHVVQSCLRPLPPRL